MADNPWLTIPLEDYESHMALPEIGQARMLAEELARAASHRAAQSVALVGCAGGNGLEALPSSVRRVVAVDINPAYVDTLRGRFARLGPALEPFVADIQQGAPACLPVDLVFAGLIFEYVDVTATMAALRAMCAPGGMLAVVIQLANEAGRFVTPSPFTSLLRLQNGARMHDRDGLVAHARAAGFRPADAREITSAGGKRFDVVYFRG